MTDEEQKAMRLALEALEHVDRFDLNRRFCFDEEIDALHAALAQPEQELKPIAWDGDCVLGHCGSPDGCDRSNFCRAAPPSTSGYAKKIESLIKERDDLRQQLAKGKQEPVAWVKEGMVRVGFGRIEERKYVQFDQTLPVGTKLYAAPVSKQEPVAQIYVKNGYWIETRNAETKDLSNGLHNIYTAPPSKPWVSLTKDDYDIIFYKHDCYDDIARAIETALRSKNT